jgi:hypothetical protein
MSVKVVNSGGGTVNVKVETTPTISVSTPEVKVVDVNPVYTSGQPGPSGPAGPAGSDGQGLETGGDKHQVLKKVDDVDYNTEWGFADRVFISVKFDEAVSAGDPVYVSGYQSGEDVVKVSKADSSDSTKMPAIGLATEDYALNAFGSVACIGSLYGIDTDDFDVGDVLYVKSGGGLTKDKPTGATNLIQNVGKVGRSQQNTGEIVVMAIGRSNDVPNIADGKIWIGNGSGVATPTTLNAAAIPDFDTEVSNNSSVAANTAKETNVTTNLTVTRDATSVTVESSDGTNGLIPQSSTTQAGVMSAASHQKLANLNASADVTNSSSVEAAGAIMDSDFTSNGLMERTGDGSYDVVAKNTDNISEGASNLYYTDARADARVSAVIDTDNTLDSPSDTLVPSQAAIKTYVDNQLGTQNLSLGTRTATQLNVDISGGGTSVTIPAANTTEAGLMTEAQFDKLASIDDNATNYGDSDVNAHLSGGTGIGYNNGVISVNGTTTFTTADSGATAVKAVINGPDGNTDDLIFTQGSNVTLTQANGNITIAATSGGIDAVEDDTDPDLGGDLDVGTHEIQSTSANNLVLKAAGTGKASLVANDGDVELVATGAGNYIRVKSDVDMSGNSIVTTSLNTDITLTPHGTGNVILGNFEFDADQSLTGKNDYVLTYNESSGHISLEEASAGSGTVDTSGTPSDDQIAIFTDADTIEGQSTLTFASNTLTIKATSSQAGYAGRLLFGVDTADQYNGDIVNFGSGPGGTNGNIEKGKLYYLDSSQQWELADANAAATASGMLGIAVVDDSPFFLVRGFARHGSWTSLGTGSSLYISAGATAGEITATAPSGSQDVVRVLGYCTNSTDREIFFNPSNDWIELA